MRDIPLLLIPLAAVLIPQADVDRIFQKKRYIELTLNLALSVVAFRAIYQGLYLREPAVGFMRNSIYFAYNLIPALVFFFELARKQHGRYWVLPVLLAVALGLTQNRMSWLVLLIYLFIRILPEALIQKRSRFALLLALGVIAFFSGMFYLLPDFSEKISRLTTLTQDPSAQARLSLWSYNWELLKSSPFFGVGFERNAVDPSLSASGAGWKTGHVLFAHNIYLQALTDNGIVGAILFFAFWIALVLHYSTLWPLFLIVALSGLSENIFNNSRAMHAVYFYAMLSILYGRFREKRVSP